MREIAAELAALGHVGASGQPYGAESVKRMIARRERTRDLGADQRLDAEAAEF